MSLSTRVPNSHAIAADRWSGYLVLGGGCAGVLARTIRRRFGVVVIAALTVRVLLELVLGLVASCR